MQATPTELEIEIAREKAKKAPSDAWKRGAKITKEDLLQAHKTGEIALKADAPPNFAPKADGIIKFGKHTGKTYEWVKQNDKGYCAWAREKGIKGF